jgi:tryptophanyl-tRNA synthetase
LSRIDYNPPAQPGVSNLLTLLSLFSGKTIDEVLEEYHGQEQYGPLKSAVADVVGDFLANFQSNLEQVDEQTIHAKLESDERLMNEQAGATLYKVQKAVGLRQ